MTQLVKVQEIRRRAGAAGMKIILEGENKLFESEIQLFHWISPMSSSFFCKASLSREWMGRLRNNSILWYIWENACWKACILTEAVLSLAAGSSIPQWALRGIPCQTGQVSSAAEPHTVNTKSISRESSFEILPSFSTSNPLSRILDFEAIPVSSD